MKNNGFEIDFGFILGGFGDYFGSQQAFKHRLFFFGMRFWRQQRKPAPLFCARPAECAGPGGIIGGGKQLAKDKKAYKSLLAIIISLSMHHQCHL